MTIKKNVLAFIAASLLVAGVAGAQYNYNTNTNTYTTVNNNGTVSSIIIPFPTTFAFTTQSQFGMTSQEIAQLQAYLATNASVYPQGLVTGYFGPLTQAAVIRFQNLYGLSPVGYLDVSTLAKLNLLISQGLLPVGGAGGPVGSIVLPFPTTFAFTSEMQFGMTSQQIAQLQAYLASNPAIYPQGLVTGYFASLTKAAVMRFQALYGIAQVGRVGPITLAKLNLLISQGLLPGGAVSSTGDVSAPFISNLTASVTSNSANVSWNTNELANGTVFYSSVPLQVQEQSSAATSIIISGTPAVSNTFVTSQMVTLSNLTPNTTYYFIVKSVDSSGNVSVTLMNTFKTTF